jgi:hypothetical protein
MTNYACNILVDIVLCVATCMTLFQKKQMGLRRSVALDLLCFNETNLAVD